MYSLEGVGATQYPFNVFVVDPKSGKIRVTEILDREFIDSYNVRLTHLSYSEKTFKRLFKPCTVLSPLFQLSGVARYTDGQLAEKNIAIRFKVKDQNDNGPVFGDITPVQVDELSPAGVCDVFYRSIGFRWPSLVTIYVIDLNTRFTNILLNHLTQRTHHGSFWL